MEQSIKEEKLLFLMECLDHKFIIIKYLKELLDTVLIMLLTDTMQHYSLMELLELVKLSQSLVILINIQEKVESNYVWKKDYLV